MVVTLIKAVNTTAKTCSLCLSDSLAYHRSKSQFISSNPSYPDSSLTSLRKREFSRLDTNGGSVYLDYTGASLYPSSLISDHAKWLKRSVAGNPHSTSPSSLLSSRATEEARKAVLDFFDADETEYDVVWTSNATAGFRIVGETYDWTGKKVLIPRDAHNSLNSLAKKAEVGGGSFEFVEFDSASSSSNGGGGQRDTISTDAYLTALSQHSNSQDASEAQKGLVFFTGQSNITGAKLSLSPLLSKAKELGWDIGLDAAALAPSTRISLRTHSSIDFMVVSLYKICGYPTGLGALIMKKSMYGKMTKKQTFFGGNIVGITMDRFDFTLVDGPERFEDGTANFTAMAAVKPGLEFAARWMDKVAKRNRMLLKWLVKELDSIYYPVEGGKEGFDEKQSFSSSSASSSFSSSSLKKPCHSKAVKLVQIGGPTALDIRGSTLPLVFTSHCGDSLNYRFVIWCAAQESISLRGGPCMCNPGASSSVMQRGLITDLEASSLLAVADVGIVRVSLGIATNFKDVWRLVHFARKLTDQRWVEKMWKSYQEFYPGGSLSNNIDELQALATRKR
ncbi:related to molybdenum cofactor sulfurase [Ustilago trichophora]|uniref:Related to molybdenum cofactor sulfurase n=1 Tax=Ustilago trichophora TaxID=86804 RepID=A0A5C3E899_9BASI|nr:related to molybdenum cofactor sulfurase [Ustilago trichophora]